MTKSIPTAEYRCPGESYSISAAVHLGRLASFHAACRNCPRRDETLGLSARQIRHLAEVRARAERRTSLDAEGLGPVAINDFGPERARNVARHFARQLADETGKVKQAVVIAGDGRLATAAIGAAIVEGMRWSGCEAIDIGPATAPCAAWAIEHLAADGGIFVGRGDGAPHEVALKFWADGEPLSRGRMLDGIAASLVDVDGTAIDRPIRKFGPLRRFAAADLYLGEFRPAFHALRPLRFVLDCASGPFTAYVEELLRNVACRVVPGEPAGRPIERQIVEAAAHFGLRINDDGQRCLVFDEQGRPVAAKRLFALLAQGIHHAERDGYDDALRTLTELLVLLSRDDRAFSAVLDQEAPAV